MFSRDETYEATLRMQVEGSHPGRTETGRDVFFCGCFDYCRPCASKKATRIFPSDLVEVDEYALEGMYMRGGMGRGENRDDVVDGVGVTVL